MFNDLIDKLNELMNDKRIKIYDITNNDAKTPKKTLCEGVFRTTSGLITRTDSANIINYNFKLDFAVPVDDTELRHEIEDKLKEFRNKINNLFFKNYRVLPSTEVAIGNEYSYRNPAERFHDYVTYYIVGTLEENNVFVGMENAIISINNIKINGILSVVPSFTNNLVKNTLVKADLKNEFKSNDMVRSWTIILNASNDEGCKLLYSMFVSNEDKLYDFRYVWFDNDGVRTPTNPNHPLIEIQTKVKVVNIDLAQTYGLITGITLKVVESL